jgi:hypothetical protein
MQQAISSTQDCEAICVQTVQYCLEVGGAHAHPSHLRLMQDCADICAATTKILLRGAQHGAEVANVCANLCDACAASCQKYVSDAQLKACANQCLLCASACRQTTSSAVGISATSSAGMGSMAVAGMGGMGASGHHPGA